MQAGTGFTYPGGMEGWVDLVDWIVPRPGVEPATFWLWVRRRTAKPLHHEDNQDNYTQLNIFNVLGLMF